MRAMTAAILLSLISACGQGPEEPLVEADAEATRSDGTGSFNLANREIREETLQLLGDAGIEYWIGIDGAINYNLVDGEEIDKIGTDVILTYIRRN